IPIPRPGRASPPPGWRTSRRPPPAPRLGRVRRVRPRSGSACGGSGPRPVASRSRRVPRKLLDPDAGRPVVGHLLDERWNGGRTRSDGTWTAIPERTPARQVERIGDLTADRLEALASTAEARHGSEERLRGGMQRAVEYLEHVGVLHDASRIRYRDRIRLLGGGAQVVLDEED